MQHILTLTVVPISLRILVSFKHLLLSPFSPQGSQSCNWNALLETNEQSWTQYCSQGKRPLSTRSLGCVGTVRGSRDCRIPRGQSHPSDHHILLKRSKIDRMNESWFLNVRRQQQGLIFRRRATRMASAYVYVLPHWHRTGKIRTSVSANIINYNTAVSHKIWLSQSLKITRCTDWVFFFGVLKFQCIVILELVGWKR